MEEKIINKDFEKFLEAARNLLELTEQIKNCDNPSLKELYISLADALETEIVEAFESYKTHLEESGCTVGEYLIKLKPFIGVLKAYEEAKKGNDSEISFIGLSQELQNEINEGLKNTSDSGLSYYEDGAVIKGLVKRHSDNATGETNINVLRGKNNDIIIKNGSLSVFDYEVFCAVMKSFREGRVTKNGQIYAKITDINKIISGTNKDAMKESRKNDIIESFENMGFRLVYKTNEELAEILGIKVEELGNEFQDIHVEYMDEQFLKYKIVGGTQYGKPVEIVIVETAEIISKMLKEFPHYEIVEDEVKCIQYINEDGELKTRRLDKKFIELRTSLIRFISSYKRARTSNKIYPPNKTYKAIFEECKVDATHGTTRKRTINNIHVILDHFKRVGFITDWHEYTNTGHKKPDGIEIVVAKELLQIGE